MKLSAREKYSYGIGALGKDMICGVIFTYAMVYFTDVLKISAAFVGGLFFFCKVLGRRQRSGYGNDR